MYSEIVVQSALKILVVYQLHYGYMKKYLVILEKPQDHDERISTRSEFEFFFSYLDARILYLPELILNMPSAVEIINFGNHN